MRLDLEIINEKGLHARASAKFVEVVESYDARVLVSRDGMEVSGDSIMGLMMLAASRGKIISMLIEGPDSEAAAGALRALVENRFGESM